MNFREILYWKHSLKSAGKIDVLWKSDKALRHCAWRSTYLYYNIALNASRNEKYLDKSCTET